MSPRVLRKKNRALPPPTGTFWWAQIIKEFNVAVPPHFGVAAGARYPKTVGISVAPALHFAGVGKSLASFRMSVPPSFDFTPPGVTAFSVSLPPALAFTGGARYPKSVSISVPPSVGFAGADQYPRMLSLSVPPHLDFIGVGHGTVTFIAADDTEGDVGTIPPHEVDDLITLFVYRDSLATIANKPAAVGTVPAWVDIDASNGGTGNSLRTAQFKATATTTTTGVWTGASHITAVVARGQHPSAPIGGHAESGGTLNSGATAPAVTLGKTDGTSLVLHGYGRRNGNWNTWGAAPVGYTTRTSIGSGTSGVCLDTKNSSTSDGPVTHPTDGNTSAGYRGATVEILAP